MDEVYEINGVIYIGNDLVEYAIAKVGDGWIELQSEATILMPELAKMKSISGKFELYHESLIEILAQIRDYIFNTYGMIPVQLLGGQYVRAYDRRNELNWLIEEATGYRMVVLNEEEEKGYSIVKALQKKVLKETGFESLVDKIKKASDTDAF